MKHAVAGRRSHRDWAGVLVLFILVLAAVAVGLFSFSAYSRNDQASLISGLSQVRVGGFRFFRASPLPFNPDEYGRVVSKAQIFIATTPDSVVNPRLRALADVGSNRLQEAAELLEKLQGRETSEILNDLGVVYWGLGEENPSNYFKALLAFERSSQLSPQALAPRFNLALAYRNVELHALANTAFQEYRRLERNLFWSDGLFRTCLLYTSPSPRDS